MITTLYYNNKIHTGSEGFMQLVPVAMSTTVTSFEE